MKISLQLTTESHVVGVPGSSDREAETEVTRC